MVAETFLEGSSVIGNCFLLGVWHNSGVMFMIGNCMLDHMSRV